MAAGKQIGIRLTPELEQAIKADAEKQRRTIAGMVRYRLEELYLDASNRPQSKD